MHPHEPHGPCLFPAQDQIPAFSVIKHGQCEGLTRKEMEILVPSTFTNSWIYLSNREKMARSFTLGCAEELLCHAPRSSYLHFPFKDEDWQEIVKKGIDCTFIFGGLEGPGLILSHPLQLVSEERSAHF